MEDRNREQKRIRILKIVVPIIIIILISSVILLGSIDNSSDNIQENLENYIRDNNINNNNNNNNSNISTENSENKETLNSNVAKTNTTENNSSNNENLENNKEDNNKQINITSQENNEQQNNNETIDISNIDEDNMSYNQIKSTLENKGLKVKTNDITQKVEYIDELAGKTTCTIEDKYESYNKGDIVTINRTTYKGMPITLGFNVRIVNIEHDKNFYCVLKEGSTIHDNGAHGVQVYFDNKLVANVTSEESCVSGVPAFEYTFSNQDKVKVKIVAPYTYTEENSNYKKNVVITEYDLKIKDAKDYYYLY